MAVLLLATTSYLVTGETAGHHNDGEEMSNTDNFAVKHTEDNFRQKSEDGAEGGLLAGVWPMRFGKRAPMRFGKRAPMRFGKRYSVLSPAILDTLEFLRSARAPMRFGKRFSSFTKKAPMRFGKRTPMIFDKRDIEEPENIDEVEEYNDVIFNKRAPMRFGKRSDYDQKDYAEEFDHVDSERAY